MDREFLFRHLEQRYLSKREMISRIPLGMQVDAIWQELLDRRRSRGTILALTGGQGRPFWYVTTDRMVSASEKIIEALFENEIEYDPYAAPPPVSTLEEVFYTSYVEGSQMTMQEAMAFLQSDSPPRDMEEQLIVNNRHAGSFASASLYRRIDAEFLKDLAFTLTDGMDTGGGEFRTEDTLEIPSMTEGTYVLPPASMIADKVAELTFFLADPGIHPLIKSAASHAWAFCIRPFPDGNERLGRLLSSIILLRSGYTFFSDVSLSALIARKGYAYYGAMDELLREENKGDLTYFMEYFMELLSRAVDERRLRILRRNEEERAAEIEMARTPLSAGSGPPVSAISSSAALDVRADPYISPIVEKETKLSSTSWQAGPMREEPLLDAELEDALSSAASQSADPSDHSFSQGPKGGDSDVPQPEIAYALLTEHSKEKETPLGKFSSYILGLLHKGRAMFSLHNAIKELDFYGKRISLYITRLKEEGVLMDFSGTKSRMVYRILAYHPDCPLPPADPKYNLLMVYAESDDMIVCQAAKHLLYLIRESIFYFTNKELAAALKVDPPQFGVVIRCLKAAGIIELCSKEGGKMIYRILAEETPTSENPGRSDQESSRDQNDLSIPPVSQEEMKVLQAAPGMPAEKPRMLQEEDYDPEVLQTIDALRNSLSSKDRRLGEMLFSNLSKGEVTYSDYVKRGEETRYKIDLFLALQIGLVEKIDANRFRILKHLSPELPKLTKAQKRVASEIYESFGEGRFSAEMVLASLNYTDGTVWAYLHNFTLLKILDCQKDGVNQYQFRITPQEHPECFDITA